MSEIGVRLSSLLERRGEPFYSVRRGPARDDYGDETGVCEVSGMFTGALLPLEGREETAGGETGCRQRYTLFVGVGTELEENGFFCRADGGLTCRVTECLAESPPGAGLSWRLCRAERILPGCDDCPLRPEEDSHG